MSRSACRSVFWLLWAAVCPWLSCHGAQAVLTFEGVRQVLSFCWSRYKLPRVAIIFWYGGLSTL